VIRQFTFDLPHSETFRAEDYFPAGCNAAAFTQVIRQDWPAGRLLLIGPAGTGKSHLAHIWAERAGAEVIAAADLQGADLAAVCGAIVVEDAHGLAGQSAGEEALFHLWNRAGPLSPLLMTAKAPPRDWGLELPDLLSRVQSLAVATLHPPDDALLAAVLVKLFADRQVHVQPNLISYLVAHMERSVSAARSMVAQLDAMALARGKPITRALAVQIIGATGELDSAGDE
jgi:chromosomal replication initiation ATPase DnaA